MVYDDMKYLTMSQRPFPKRYLLDFHTDYVLNLAADAPWKGKSSSSCVVHKKLIEKAMDLFTFRAICILRHFITFMVNIVHSSYQQRSYQHLNERSQ